MWAAPYRGANEAKPFAGPANAERLTRKQKIEMFLQHVVLHEVGHTLGLRHNFKGSLVPPSSSTMEYIVDQDAVHRSEPGSYDIAAIQLLYGMTFDNPVDPFCNDDDVPFDPDCKPFDVTSNPLIDFYEPRFEQVAGDFIADPDNGPPNVTLNNVLQYVRAGTPDEQIAAWGIASAPAHAPAAPESLAANPDAATGIDFVARRLLSRLYLDPPEDRGDFINDPPSDAADVQTGIMAELRANILNQDMIRSWETRRVCVDILKKLQTADALQILVDAKASLGTEKMSLTAEASAQADDLGSRISNALNPYFTSTSDD
jgi:hypothetical protein